MILHQESHSESHPWIKCVFKPLLAEHTAPWHSHSSSHHACPHPPLWPPSGTTWFITPIPPSAPAWLLWFLYWHFPLSHLHAFFMLVLGQLACVQRRWSWKHSSYLSYRAWSFMCYNHVCLRRVSWLWRLDYTDLSVSAHLLVHVKISPSEGRGWEAACCFFEVTGKEGADMLEVCKGNERQERSS